MKSLLSLSLALAALTSARADLTYVDASSGAGGNTTLANGSTFNPPGEGTTGTDNNWEQRSPFAVGGSAFESGGEVAENAPELRTTLSGLTPGVAYRIYVHFWDASAWRIRAGFVSGSTTLFAAAADVGSVAGSTAAPLASSLSYASPPSLFTEGNRTMSAGLVGTTVANASGQISVFIDDGPASGGANGRTWYDGLSYEEVSSNPVTYVDATTANTVRWDGQPFTPPADGTTGNDNNWEVRALANDATVFESHGEGGVSENAPLLATTIGGLTPNTDYVIYGYFWGTAANWRLKASAKATDIQSNGTPGNLADDFLPTLPKTHFAAVNNASGTATLGRDATGTAFSNAPLVAQADRLMKEATLGKVTSNASGNITVYVDDFAFADGNNRTWYDGLGYKLAVALSPTADEDGDGLSNGAEASAGTDPYLPDSDGDGFSDGVEVSTGSDPLDANSLPPFPGNALQIVPDGAWTWFNDERAIFHQGSLFSGYVKGNGEYGITRYDPATNQVFHTIISTVSSQQQDDHNNPSITPLPDGKLLILYSKHNSVAQYYQRTSLVPLPSSIADWGPEIVRTAPANNTYANTYRLSGESDRIYNFHRSINFNPTLTISNDLGANWQPSVQFVDSGSGSTRPYIRLCSNHVDRIDMLYTDGHPRDVNNSIYHLYIQSGNVLRSDGSVIKSLGGLPLDHDAGERGSAIYNYSAAAWGSGQGPDDYIPTGRAWGWDVHYGEDGKPVCAFQVQRDDVTGTGWNHDRIYYYYARWTGTGWQKRFIAQAGRPLYSAEDDYGGGMTIDPDHPNVVYIASNAADPFNLADISNVTLRAIERYEIFRGVTTDGGLTFTWEQITTNSPADNLRPIVPERHGFERSLLWFHGTYSSYTSYSTRVLGIFENAPAIRGFSSAGGQGVISWRSSAGRRYKITGSTNLNGFPVEVVSDVMSQGGSTTQQFIIPVPLATAPDVYFRVEEK